MILLEGVLYKCQGIVFIHFYSASHSTSLCRSLHAEALQATASDELSQGP